MYNNFSYLTLENTNDLPLKVNAREFVNLIKQYLLDQKSTLAQRLINAKEDGDKCAMIYSYDREFKELDKYYENTTERHIMFEIHKQFKHEEIIIFVKYISHEGRDTYFYFEWNVNC